MEQARLDEDYEEVEEEEEGAGDDFRVGDWCRAEWSEDAVVYEVLYRNHFFNIVQKGGSIKPMFEKIQISQRHFDIRFTQDWHRIFFKLTKGLFKCRIV